MNALKRFTTFVQGSTSRGMSATGGPRVIPGPFMMGWVVDVPPDVAARWTRKEDSHE
jgi:hypothetical protein